MIIKQEINGKFITGTTRRGNHTNIYFGKITAWPSKEHYINGDCMRARTLKNLWLGVDSDKFKEKILEAGRILVNEIDREEEIINLKGGLKP